jgi:hypothetical protein
MQVHLNPPLEPGTAHRHAAAVAATAADVSGAVLDYSPESLGTVEEIVDGFRAEGMTAAYMADALVSFGCYVGEMLARDFGGVWRYAAGTRPLTVPLVVELPGAREYHPIDWVFGRLERGGDVSIRALYTAAGAAGAAAAGTADAE